jgi:hypothetical protein
MPLTNFTKGVASAPPVSVTTATLTANKDDHANRPLVLDRAGGITVTLPAATGTGHSYRFFVKTTFTGNGIVKVANSTDVMTGFATLHQDGADTVATFDTAASSDTITLNGTTTGGLLGSSIELVDLATGLWAVAVHTSATGVEATPFSATV